MYLAYVILMNFSRPLLHSAVDVQLIFSATLSPSAKVPEVGVACAEDQCLLVDAGVEAGLIKSYTEW